MIQQDDEIRIKIVGTRVDAKDIVSFRAFLSWGWMDEYFRRNI